MNQPDIQDIPILSTELVGGFRPLSSGIDRMIQLSDGSLLLVNTRPDKPSTVFRLEPNIGKVRKLKVPIEGESWVVSVPPDRLLVAQPNSTNAVLWNPVTGGVKVIDVQTPRGDSVCSDILDGKLYIIVNWNVSGCGGGFEWSDDDTELAIFDLRKERFVKPFYAVEDHDMRAIVMQSKQRMVGFGYGRASHYFGLFNRKLEWKLNRAKDRDAFRMKHHISVGFVGTDAERALIMFGQKGNAEERAVVRWTLAKRKFEIVGIIDNTDLFFRCSTPLNDGTILLFCWERHTNDHTIFRYRMGQPLECVGRMLDTRISAAAQGRDGRVYLAGHGTVSVMEVP